MNADCLKLTSYFGERHRTGDQFLADALLDLYERRQIAVSALIRGAIGFGLKHHLRTDRLLTLSEDLPVVAVAVDARHRIEQVAAEISALTDTGLVTLERAQMLSTGIASCGLPDQPGEETKLTIYLGRQERIQGVPAFTAVCDLLHRRRVAGATVLLGVDGTAHGVRQRARFFGRNADVPVMVIAVGDGDQIAQIVPELADLLDTPLLTLERVRICKRDGKLLAHPSSIPQTDEQASGASTVPTRPTVTASFSCAATSQPSRSSSTHRRRSRRRSRSSTPPPQHADLSQARWSRRWRRSPPRDGMAGCGLPGAFRRSR